MIKNNLLVYIMRNTLVFLKSDESTFNTDINYNRWSLTNPIQARKDELLTIQVIEAEFPVTYYNVDSTNNVLELIVVSDDTNDSASNEDYTETYTLTFDPQNYSASQIATEINSLSDQTHSGITCSYSKRTGKIIITATATTAEPSDSIQKITIGSNTTCNKLIGFSIGQTLTQPTLGNVSLDIEGDNIVDVNRTNNIYMETDLLLESRNTYGEKSGILAKIQQNKKFLDVVHYQTNHDLPLELYKKDTYIDHIDLRILDDNNSPINFNGENNYSITLLFQYIKKEKLLLGDDIQNEVISIPILSTIDNDNESDCLSDDEN